MLKQKAIAILIFGYILIAGASYALADTPPAPPVFPPDPPTIDATETTTETATVASATTAASTATSTSSGPADVAIVVGLGVIAILCLRKYSKQKKYSL